MFRKILILFCLTSLVLAEIGLSGGITWGESLQSISGAERIDKLYSLSPRLAYFVELDSLDHPLFLENDQIVFGLGFLTETAHKDWILPAQFQLSIPLYVTYYLRFGAHAIGLGGNLNLLQIRYRNDLYMQGQQLGKQLFYRYNAGSSYLEFGVMQLCARGDYPDEELISFYDSLNFILRYGFYLGGKNTL